MKPRRRKKIFKNPRGTAEWFQTKWTWRGGTEEWRVNAVKRKWHRPNVRRAPTWTFRRHYKRFTVLDIFDNTPTRFTVAFRPVFKSRRYDDRSILYYLLRPENIQYCCHVSTDAYSTAAFVLNEERMKIEVINGLFLPRSPLGEENRIGPLKRVVFAMVVIRFHRFICAKEPFSPFSIIRSQFTATETIYVNVNTVDGIIERSARLRKSRTSQRPRVRPTKRRTPFLHREM